MATPSKSLTPGANDATVAEQLGIPVARVRAIRAANLARLPAAAPQTETVQPLTPAMSAQLAQAGRGSGLILTPAQQHYQQQASTGAAGYRALSALVGPALASDVPGTTPPPGYHAGLLAQAVDVAGLLPIGRGARVVEELAPAATQVVGPYADRSFLSRYLIARDKYPTSSLGVKIGAARRMKTPYQP
jgi:hypothetical protein